MSVILKRGDEAEREKKNGLCLRLIIRGAHTLGVKVVFVCVFR